MGGGVAGLAAAAELHVAGIGVRILEARERLGGRTWSIPVGGLQQPVELGAEFIHGKPPEIFSIAKQAGLDPIELGGENFASDGKKVKVLDFFEESESVLNKLNDHGPDRSFMDFVRQEAGDEDPEELKWAMRFVRGFHAADPEQISVHAMVRESKAEDEIEGDLQFRPRQGYAALVRWYEQRLSGAKIELNTGVRRIRWNEGGVEVETPRGGFRGRKLIVTLPLGVLQAGDVVFDPELPEKQEATSRLAMGKILRVTLQFRDCFWTRPKAGVPDLSKMHFLMADDDYFPTWWTMHPVEAPLLVGWSPDKCADRMKGMSQDERIAQARQSLQRALPDYAREIGEDLVAGFVHDWQADIYSRGAYSYVRVGGLGAQEALAAPVHGTLFFAGEATESKGHHATVHGAIATGLRAAEEVKQALGRA